MATQPIADLALDALQQRREIQLALFDTARYSDQAQPTDADLQAYYEQHKTQYEQAEQASIEYLVLDLPAVRARITINEDDLRTYYKENGARLAGYEERRASHILINAPKTMPTAEREAAKAKAT